MASSGIALQLYTVRDQTATDMLGTLRKLAEMGYRAVEFAGYGGVPVAELRQTLDELGMKAPSAHISYDAFATRFDAAIDEAKTLGCDHVVVPFLAPEQRGVGRVAEIGDHFNEWAGRCREAGLRFGYHNHAFEFEPTGGPTVFDLLLEATEPDLVDFEIDVYWTAFAGVDAVPLIQRLKGRTPVLHVKDMGSAAERPDVPFGEGVIDWDPVFAAAAASGTEWYVVEQDNPGDSLVDSERSLRNLEQRLGAV